MSTFEGRGSIGEFRPAPALLSQDIWREVWDLVSGKRDDHGRSGPAALAARLRTIAGEAAYEAAFRRVGYRWRSMSDREWFEFVVGDVLEDLRAVLAADHRARVRSTSRRTMRIARRTPGSPRRSSPGLKRSRHGRTTRKGGGTNDEAGRVSSRLETGFVHGPCTL
jgi:hypothetical protein